MLDLDTPLPAIGDSFRIRKGSTGTVKCHVLAIVDDVYVVYKWYGKHKQYWHYDCEWWGSIETQIKRATTD